MAMALMALKFLGLPQSGWHVVAETKELFVGEAFN
jgi:hypothetical protein